MIQETSFLGLLRNAGVPSYAMARVRGDQVTVRAQGVRKQGEAATVSGDTVYAAASLTKQVFAYALLTLVEEGKLSLDTPVHQYVPVPDETDERSQRITMRHLLSHSGGWRNWRNAPADRLTSAFDPGSRWLYSGEGYYHMQRIMEQVTGQGMPQVVRDRVFEPLGMTRSSMAGLESLEPHMATGHNMDGDPRQPFGRPTLLELRRQMAAKGQSLEQARVEDAEAALKVAEPNFPTLPNFLSPNAAASMFTTANDYGKFLRHLVMAPSRGGAAAVIARQMVAPQVRRNAAIQWGLGFGVEEVDGRPVGWQWGDNPGFKNFVYLDPERREGLVIFTNGDRGARVYERVIRGVTGTDHPAFLYI